MAGLKHWVIQVLLACDQVLTAILGGWADETLSSYAFRLERQGRPWGKVTRPLIDKLFFWEDRHCYHAYLDEYFRRQLPPMLRGP